MIGILVAKAIVVSLVATVDTSAQDDTTATSIDYTWRNQTIKTVPVVRGEVVTLKVSNFNSLCYTLKIDVSDQAVLKQDDAVASFIKQLAPAPTKPQVADFVADSARIASLFDALGGAPASLSDDVDHSEAPAVRALAESMGASVSPADGVVQSLNAMIAHVQAALREAQSRLREDPTDELTAYQDAARNALAEVTKNACGRGSNWSETWDDRREAVSTLADSGPLIVSADRELKSIADVLTRNANALQSLERVLIPLLITHAPTRAASAIGALRQIETFRLKLAADTQAQARALSTIAENRLLAEGSRDAIEKAVAGRELTRAIVVRDDADRLRIRLEATGRKGQPSEGIVLEDAFTVNVEPRRFRLLVSTGWMAGVGVPDSHFERVNLPGNSDPKSALPDTAYSTFANTSNGHFLAFAPVILTTLVFNQGREGWGVSTGIAARSVRNRVRPEYLVGLSGILGDRFLITLAAHIGQVERLLIGDADEVKKKSVPTSISDKDAVGVGWRVGGSIVISIRPW